MARLLTLRADADATVALAPAVTARELLRRFWPYARPYRGKMLVSLGLLAFVPAAEAAGIWLFGVLVDDVLTPADLSALLPLALAMLALTVVGGIVAYGEEMLSTWVGERFVLDLRVDLFDRLQRSSLHALQRRRLGDLLSRLNGDVQAIESFVLGAIGDGLAALLRLAFFGAALMLLEWRLALAALVVVPAFVTAARSFSRLTRRTAREQRRRAGSLTAVAEERLAAAALVQAHGREREQRDAIAREGMRIMEARLVAARLRGLYAPVVDLIELAGALIVIILGTWALDAGALTLGGLLAFLTYLTKMYAPVNELGALATSVFAAAAGGERVAEVLDGPVAVRERPAARDLPAPTRGEIELRDVGYAHPGSPEPVLYGIDLRIPAGATAVVVGPSGVGKSTLVSLIARMADPDAGAVLLDGSDLRDATVASTRAAIGVLLQETLLFDASIRDNVAFGRPGASEAEIRAALAAAGADDFTADLDAVVGQRGRALSGGQARRLALARELLRDTAVLVLDEPTTGLDGAARDALLPALRASCRGRTAIIVTHDPVVAAEADLVVELRDGRAVTSVARDPEAAAA